MEVNPDLPFVLPANIIGRVYPPPQGTFVKTFQTAAAIGLAGVAALSLAFVRPASEAEQTPQSIAPFVEPGFPFFGSTVDARKLGAPENVATRGIVLLLGNDTYATFDPDLLRMAIGWRGEFLELTTMAQISYQEAGNKENSIPRVLGTPVFTTGIYPGWMTGRPDFRDPRPAGANPEDVGRGPLPAQLGRWSGLYTIADTAVLSYSVGDADILEQAGTIAVEEEVGIARTVRVAVTTQPLTLLVAELTDVSDARVEGNVARVTHVGDTLTGIGVTDAPANARLEVIENRYVTLQLPALTSSTTFRVVVWRGAAANEKVLTEMLSQPVRMVDFARGGARRWKETVRTRGNVSPDTGAYVVDRLTLPLPNPWRRNVRVADAGFFEDGRRAAVVTFEGDVWIVSGIDRDLRNLEWQRFASGLYEPLGIEVVDGEIFTHSRDGIVHLRDLNGDGEADFYENFSNLVIQSIESREFPLGFGAKPGGGFYLGRGGALDMGPRTAAAIMPGFRAGSRHSGSVLEVSADGRDLETFASGLREPFIGVHPELDIVTASDQQGNFVPATPIYLVSRGGYHGVPATAHREDVPPETPPIVWIPHEVDQSGASQVWVTGDRMGFGGDALIHLSYGRPAAFRVFIDSTSSVVQGALVPLLNDFPAPLLNGAYNTRDGHLYLTGFQIWGSRAQELSVFARVRHTGMPSPLPLSVHAGRQGVVMRFVAPLDPVSINDLSRYHVNRWNYQRTEQYGSGHFMLDGSPGEESLPVAAAHISADAQSLLLLIPDVREVMQMKVGYSVRFRDGRTVSDTLYLTLNSVDELNLANAGFGAVDWRASIAAARPATTERDSAQASVALGVEVYERIGCMVCHSVDGSTEGKVGPTFRGLYGSTRTFVDGSTRTADETYLRESILEPARHVVRGFPAEMPSYVGVLGDAEIESLVRYIRSLGNE
jgi:cytochrome c2